MLTSSATIGELGDHGHSSKNDHHHVEASHQVAFCGRVIDGAIEDIHDDLLELEGV